MTTTISRPATPAAPPAARRRSGFTAMKRSKWRAIVLLLAPFLALYVLAYAIPLCYAVYESFFTEKRSGLGFGAPERVFAGFGNYAAALAMPEFTSGVWRVLLLGVVQDPLMLVIALLLALAIDALANRFAAFMRLVSFLPYAVPGVIAAILWAFLYLGGTSPFVRALDPLGVHLDFLAGGTVLWIAPDPDAWPPGLARFGLSPAQLVLVRAPREQDGLWAMEETLRCPAVGAALLVTRELDLTAARRLQLAAEAGGVLGLLLRPDEDNAVLLGYTVDGAPRIAMPIRAPMEELEARFRLTDGRSAFRDGLLDEETLGIIAQGISLVHWSGANLFCGKCGTKTVSQQGGYKRSCPNCGHMMFPRTDPVVIMLTVDIERDLVLLGRGHHFAPGMYSTLAGFVEPGETIEDAVRRETFEEAGIRAGRVRYHASQPWPMPHSLMIGCYAEALDRDINRDEQELADCRWFTRDEIATMLDADPSGEGPFSPPRGAIAHRLMRDWVEWQR